jgi:pescadillo protein
MSSFIKLNFYFSLTFKHEELLFFLQMGVGQDKEEKSKYITRTRAVRKLQLTLPQFRRLCILKGIYPVEPKNKRKENKGSSVYQTFYHLKDIQFLLHEPIIDTIREDQIHVKKLGRLLAKREYKAFLELKNNKPQYMLDNIIKERYPTFDDALGDLDDCISNVFLFATLPADELIDHSQTQKCKRLCGELMQYVILSKSLQKVFLSIKGIYYQVKIRGQEIVFIAPYQFSQSVPTDVDWRVMGTFLELHTTLLQFVLFKLYSDMNLVYPPHIDREKDDADIGLPSIIVESKDATKVSGKKIKISKEKMNSLQEKIASIEKETEDKQNVDLTIEEAPEEDFPAPIDSENAGNLAEFQPENGKLFDKCVFWLSREVPRYSLEFVIRACGGRVGYPEETSFVKEDSPLITHQIIDRPGTGAYENREYLQPQWIYDCINNNRLISTVGYHQNENPPPHMSPFVIEKEYIEQVDFSKLERSRRRAIGPCNDVFKKPEALSETQRWARTGIG